jgi:DNA-binding NarL/FixJ family response regulator
MKEDPGCILQSLRRGVSGYLLNYMSAVEMIAAVRSVAQGEAVCPPKLRETIFEHVTRGFLPEFMKVEPRNHAANALTCRQGQLMAPWSPRV